MFSYNNMYNRIRELCAEQGITDGKLKELAGLSSRNILQTLKKDPDNKLSYDNAKKIADYFNVSVSYILGEEDKKISSTSNEVLDDVTVAILERLSHMSLAEKNRALGYLDSYLDSLALLASQENDGGSPG